MRLRERLNVLVQAITLSQKSGVLTLDEAVKAKTAIDIISSGILNQNFASAINVLIEITSESQKKGVYSLKDAHMIYLAIEGIEIEIRQEVNMISEGNKREVVEKNEPKNTHVLEYRTNTKNNINENVISIPPKTLKKE